MIETRVGEVLASKYRLEELLGTGGMGDVYRAVNQLVGRQVAIKLLRAEHATNPNIVERFMREARTANLVRHPNVVDVIDIGQDDGGVPFIVQELLAGEDLAKYMERRGALGVEEALDLLCPIIDAVAEAHAQNVVHRDIKPENVFLSRSSRGTTAKLLDFGISKVRAADVRATDAGLMLGTPAYMPPEQIAGAREADPRSDVWALGVMLFEVLSGRLPFDDAEAPALFVSIATKDAPALVDVRPEVSPTVSRIVARCLRRKREERYPSAAELARDLRHAKDGEDIEPTAKRSVPPSFALAVPDLDLGVPKAPAMPDFPEVPALDVPKPRPSSSRSVTVPLATAPTPPPAPAPEPPSRPQIVPLADLSGVVMPPASSPSRRTAPHVPRPSRAAAEEHADMSSLYALLAVALLVIGSFGALMAIVHRVGGWPLAQFLLMKPAPMVVLGIHGALALVAVLVAGTYAKRAFSQWRGDVSGGRVGAIVATVVSAAAFFVAAELVFAISTT